jgi:hypothetical protein
LAVLIAAEVSVEEIRRPHFCAGRQRLTIRHCGVAVDIVSDVDGRFDVNDIEAMSRRFRELAAR